MILGRHCLCCKNCTECQEFKNILSENGFELYLYIKNPESISKNYDLLEHQGFIFQNTQDVAVNSNDLLKKIESSDFTCQRCRAILQRLVNVFKNTTIKKNEIIVICDCYINDRISCGVGPCKYCHNIYDKFNLNKSLQDSITKEYTEKWISQIIQILNRKSSTQKLVAFRRKTQEMFKDEPILSDISSPQNRLRRQARDVFKNEAAIHQKDSSLSSMSPERIYVRNESKAIIDIPKVEVQSQLDINEVTKIEGDLSGPKLSQDFDMEYGGFKSLTTILTKFSKETFKYVFPKTDTGVHDLKEYVSSSELLKELQQKVLLLKQRQKQESLRRETKQKKKKVVLRVTSDEDKDKELLDVSSGTSEGKSITKRRKMVDEANEEKIGDILNVSSDTSVGKHITRKRKMLYEPKKDNKITDISSDTTMDHGVSTRQKKVPKSVSPKTIDSPEKTKRKTDKDISSRRVEESIKESVKKTKERPPTKKDSGTEMKYAEVKPEQIKQIEEGGDGLLMTMKKASKELLKKKQEKEPSLPKPKKESKLQVSESYTKAMKEAKDKLTAPKQSKDTKDGENEKKSKPAYTANLNASQVKIRKGSLDDNDIGLLKIKDSAQQEKAKTLTQSELYLPPPKPRPLPPKVEKSPSVSREGSELDTDVDELLKKSKLNEVREIIIGQKILKHKLHYIDKMDKRKEIQPLLFESTFNAVDTEVKKEVTDKSTSFSLYTEGRRKRSREREISDQDAAKGTVRYALSNRSFIDKGWTMLPTEKIVRKLNVYRMRPSHPEFNWFENNKSKQVMYYDTGEILAEFHEDGRGRWFYRNGRLALDYYNAEEMNAGQRYVVYSNGEPDEKGCARPITVLATFDYLGNGIVFDHTGKIRLKYNQTEGIVLDKSIGPVSHWKWHELNDPPILQKVMLDTQMAVKDPEILKLGGKEGQTPRIDNEEMLAIEFDNFIKEKSKKLTQKFKPFQIKMKALKVNENFSLRVLDQASVYLTFRDGPTNMKLNLGMILDHKEIVDTDTAEVGEVSCNVERFPARTDSLAMLQHSIAHAQYVEKLRIERERRFKTSEVNPSIDRLTAALSRPLQPALKFQKLSDRIFPETECYCNTKNPPTCQV